MAYRVTNPAKFWEGEGGGAGIILPPDFTGNAATDLISTALSPGVTVSAAPRSWGNPTGAPNPTMTSPTAPAPYSVVGEQPSGEALPSTAVKEWDQPAWGAFTSVVNRAYLNVYDYGYSVYTGQAFYLRTEVTQADRTVLREPRRVLYGGPARRVKNYTIKAAFNNREPLAWTLHAGNSAVGPWTLLDTRNHVAGSLATNPLHNTTEGTFEIAPELMPSEGFTHYLLTFTRVHAPPAPEGGNGYIDLTKIAFREYGFTIRSLARTIPSFANRAGLVIRLGGRTNLSSTDVAAQIARDAVPTWKSLRLSPVAVLSDNTTIFAGGVDMRDLPAGTSLNVNLRFPANDLRLFGWNFGAEV